MYIALSTGIFVVLIFALGVVTVRPELADPPLFWIFFAVAWLNVINIVLSLIFLFFIDTNRSFRTGWACLIVFLSLAANPVFWYARVRPHYTAA